MRLFQATRVVAATAGSQRSSVLEAPFIGRDRELRLVKELFHASAERHSARLVLVSGVAGVGKSRLALGVLQVHRRPGGRSALARRSLPFLRRRRELLGAFGDGPRQAPDRRGGSPRRRGGTPAVRSRALDHRPRPTVGSSRPASPSCSGSLRSRPSSERSCSAGWRLFFERLAEHLPVVMVVEDLQWADAGMVDFLDHLLEWSADHAIFLLVLTRPEGTDRSGLGSQPPQPHDASRSIPSRTR